MAKTTRFALAGDNRIAMSTTKLINGDVSYTNPPPKSEDAQYPMSNLQINDRYSIHRTANDLTGTFNVDWDIGSIQSEDVLCVHGFRRKAGETSPDTCDVYYQAGATYDGNGTWKKLASLALDERDAGIQLVAPVRAQFFRFTFGVGASGGGFSWGQPYIGNLSHDLKLLYSPGATDRVTFRRARAAALGGGTVLAELGDEGRVITLPFRAIKTDLKDILRLIGREILPITYISAYDEVMQVLPSNDEHVISHLWGSGTDLWDSVLELTRLA